MQLILNELYFDNDRNVLLLQLFTNNTEEKILKNIKYLYKIEEKISGKIETTYFIDLECASIDIINNSYYLEEICNYAKTNYIDKNIFNLFLEQKYKDELEEFGKTTKLSKVKPTYASIGYKNKTYLNPKADIRFQADEDYNELYLACEGANLECKQIYKYDDQFFDEKGYVYLLLNIVLNCNFNIVLKKCKRCENFFFTTSKKTVNCNRIYKDNLTCKKYNEKVKIDIRDDDSIKRLIKNTQDKLRYSYKLNEFSKLLYKKKELSKKEFVNWILDDYYFTEKGRLRIIKRLHLEKYLD